MEWVLIRIDGQLSALLVFGFCFVIFIYTGVNGDSRKATFVKEREGKGRTRRTMQHLL